MSFLYRFLDDKGDVLYIGKTENLKKRISGHFRNGNLSDDCYFDCEKIEYLFTPSSVENDLQEIQLINKYKPKYNKQYHHNYIVDTGYQRDEDWIEYNFDLDKAKFLYIANKKKVVNELIEEVYNLKKAHLEIEEKLDIVNKSLKAELNIEIDGINFIKDNDTEYYGEFISILHYIYNLIRYEDNNEHIKKSTNNTYFVNIKQIWELHFNHYDISRNTFFKLCRKTGVFKGDSTQYYKSVRLKNEKAIKCYLMNVNQIEFLLKGAL